MGVKLYRNPIQVPPDGLSYGKPIKIYDFKKGMNTDTPQSMLPDGASPFLANVWVDDRNALTKMPGTSLVLSEANNAFCHECYNLYVYRTPMGNEILIINGTGAYPNADTMKLWSLDNQTSYPAAVDPTDITPDSGLMINMKVYFTNYRGCMYISNGFNNLKRWNGSTWEEYHGDENEHFKFLEVYNDCLVGAYTPLHPDRIVYSEQNGDNFEDYYTNNTHWRMIPTGAGDYITGIKRSPWGSLLVFFRNSIHEIVGDMYTDGDVRQEISTGIGAIDQSLIVAHGDAVYFVWEDGIYMLGRRSVVVSHEDEALKTNAKVTPVSAEIRKWFVQNVTLPEPGEVGEKIWSGYEDFCQTIAFDAGSTEIEYNDRIWIGGSTKSARVIAVDLDGGAWGDNDAAGTLYITDLDPYNATFTDNDNITIGSTQAAVVRGSGQPGGWTYYLTRVNKAPLSDHPDVINWNRVINDDKECFHSCNTSGGGNYQGVVDEYVSLRSTGGKYVYYAEEFKSGAKGNALSGVALYLKEIGDVSDNTLKIYVTDETPGEEPDFTTCYGEGSIDGGYLHSLKVIPFDAGGTEIREGDTIANAAVDATKTATVKMVVCVNEGSNSVPFGTWTGDDAEGYLYVTTASAWADDDPIFVSTTQCAVMDGDLGSIADGMFVFIPMTYFDYPQTMRPYGQTVLPKIYLAAKITGDDADNYLQWGYTETDVKTNFHMRNSDLSTPEDQDELDYAFKVYERPWNYAQGYIETTPYYITETFQYWHSVSVTLDEKVIETYVRESLIEKIEYEIRTANSGWGTYTETTNGGGLSGSLSDGRWIKLKITFNRPTAYADGYVDSFTVKDIRVRYIIEPVENALVGAAIWENRAWFSMEMTYPEEPAGGV
jgi:hypothetical protein